MSWKTSRAQIPGDGLVPPMNAPGAGQPLPGVQPGVNNGVIVAHLVIITASGGWFIYSGTPGLGNPPIIWASGSLTDPYGNTLPAQFGITGTGTFQAGDTLITPSGTYVYSGTPGAGNLFVSISSTAGTDPFGNTVLAGAYAYGPSGSSVGLTSDGTFARVNLAPPGPAAHLTLHPSMLAATLNAGLVNEQILAEITSGKESGNPDAAVQLFSASADNTIAPELRLEFGGVIVTRITQAAEFILTGASVPNVTLQPSGSAHVTSNPNYLAELINAGAVNEVLESVLSSGKESSNDDAALQLFSESADATSAARAVIEFGGFITMTLNKTGISVGVPITADTWHAMALGNGWVQQGGNVNCQYRKTPFNEVEIIGVMSGAASTANSFFTLPSGYRPASQQPACSATSTVWDAGFIQCTTAGVLSVQSNVHTGIWAFHGFISLDA